MSSKAKVKGTRFEYQVAKYLNSLKLKARRRKLSGSDLKKPYDVRVYGALWEKFVTPEFYKNLFPLDIEAKRVMTRKGQSAEKINVEMEWLKKIGKKFIVVFSVGRSPGIKLRMWSISMYKYEVPFITATVAALTIRKNKTITLRDLALGALALIPQGSNDPMKGWLVQPFDQWLHNHKYIFTHDEQGLQVQTGRQEDASCSRQG